MKVKYLWGVIFASLLLSCDDNTGSLGLTMLPGSDEVVPKSKIYYASTTSIIAGPVFAKTSTGYVGKFTDPDFGYYETGFLTQLNCTDDFSFPEVYTEENPLGVMAGDTMHMAELIFYYEKGENGGFFGDSLNACRMSVYELNKHLDKNYYTNIVPEEYYSPANLLGRKAYAAVDLSVSLSDRNLTTYYPNVRMQLSDEFGKKIFNLSREHPEYFKDADSFINNVFKGIYVKSDEGDGTILYIEKAHLNIWYRVHCKDSAGLNLKKTENGEDSLAYSYKTFAATKEVIQANQFINSDKLTQRAEEKDWTYVKSPAGIFTQATLPIQEIADELSRDTINSVKLTFTHYTQTSEYKFKMGPPQHLLLIREKEMKTFFETNQLSDDISSYLAERNSSTNQYTFSNITKLVIKAVSEKVEAKESAGSNWDEKAWEEENKWDKVLLIPVKANIETNTSTGAQTLISIYNNMSPGYAKLKGGEKNALEVEVVYTTFPNSNE